MMRSSCALHSSSSLRTWYRRGPSLIATLAVIMVALAETKRTHGDAPYPLEWVQSFNDGGALYVEGLAVDPTGNVVAAGIATSGSYVRKISPVGDTEWFLPPDGDAARFEIFDTVAADRQGNTWIGGSTSDFSGSNPVDAHLLRLNSAGSIEIQHDFAGPRNEQIRAIAVGKDNGITMVQDDWSNSEPVTLHLRSMDREGGILWDYHDVSKVQAGRDIAADLDGGSLVVSSLVTETVVTKYASDGNIVNQFEAKSPADRVFFGGSIAVAPDGSVYLGGENFDRPDLPSTGDGALQKYSPDGELLWAVEFPSAGRGQVEDVAVDRFGNTYVTGITSDLAYSDFDAFVAQIDENGSLLWQQFLAGPRTDYGRRIGVDALGNVYMGGHSYVDSSNTVALVAKYASGMTVCDAIGQLDWSGRNDAVVDVSDLNAVRDNFGSTGDYLLGDADGNYVVDLNDLNSVRNCFVAVPEPATLVISATSLLIVTLMSRFAHARRRLGSARRA